MLTGVKPQEPARAAGGIRRGGGAGADRAAAELRLGVATSSYHKNGYAIEQAEADLNNLVAHVESIEPDVDAVFVIGGSRR